MARLIGYGAYNLCFDNERGALNGGSDFFTYLHDEKKSPINLVKVICHRNATLEGLTDTRVVQPYLPGGVVNPGFLANLAKLVVLARAKQFTVQICIFSYHSVARREQPENMPKALADLLPLAACDREKRFFTTINNADILAAQVDFVRSLVTYLRDTNNLSNVIWEIANEVRVDTCGQQANIIGNCELVAWLNYMADTIRDATGPLHRNMIMTSTGVHRADIPGTPAGGPNERMTFDKTRPADGCVKAAFIPHATLSPGTLFDLHRFQWNFNDNWRAELSGGIQNRFAGYGYGSDAKFIINTDGMPDDMRTPANIKAWATAAFRNGHHFASKELYPPVGWNDAVIEALTVANAAVPL